MTTTDQATGRAPDPEAVERGLLDGAVGLRPHALDIPDRSTADWAAYVRDLRTYADSFATTPRRTS